MEANDIPFAMGLTASEGWSDIPSDFEALLGYSPNAVFVAERSKEKLGMVSAVSYGAFGFIGCLIVQKERRNRGIGTELTRYAADHLERLGNERIFLDAVQEAIPLYERLGFRRVCYSMRFRGCVQCRPDSRIRPIHDDDIPSVLALDMRVFGADRSYFLRHSLDNYRNTCRVATQDGRIMGYCLATQTQKVLRIGPLVVDSSADTAECLIRGVTYEEGLVRASVGVLERNSEAIALYRNIGLQETTPSVRMIRGGPVPERVCGEEFGIGSPARG
jgi:predicted N-acetyltransferase YhbS